MIGLEYIRQYVFGEMVATFVRSGYKNRARV